MTDCTNPDRAELTRAQAAAANAAVARLEQMLAALDAKVDDLMLADARRLGFWSGARFGAQLVLFSVAGALGGAAGKFIGWLTSAFQGN